MRSWLLASLLTLAACPSNDNFEDDDVCSGLCCNGTSPCTTAVEDFAIPEVECPALLAEAMGTACSGEGDICSNCFGQCGECITLECSSGVWSSVQPQNDCVDAAEATNDAGP